MAPSPNVLAYYATPEAMTDVGPHADAAARIGPDIAAVVAAVQGLLIYDTVTKVFYDIDTPAERANEIHLRPARAIFDRARELDARPIDEPRALDEKVLGRCRDFTVLTVALLRAQGIPARARCGFGAYFGTGNFEDHWVVETWDAADERWRLVDAQLDDVWVEKLGFRGNALDLTSDEFIIAGRAWQDCRCGARSPDSYGLTAIGMLGLDWVASNTRLDLAALNKVEMLPWDAWGIDWAPGSGDEPSDLTPLDEVADLTVDADERFDAIRSRYERDEAFKMPGTVFNALTQRRESIEL